MNARLPPRPHLPRQIGMARWGTVTAAVYRVFREPERTEDIVLAEEITAKNQLAYLRDSGLMRLADGQMLMRDRPEFGDLDLDQLRTLPEHTLGYALARFFDENGLDTKLYGVPAYYTDDPDCAYLMKRIRAIHDLFHVLMNFTIQEHDEILLHGFSYAQTGLPASIALMALGGLKTMVFEARWGCLRSGIRAAYRRGERAERLIPVYWEQHLADPLHEVRERYRIQPWTQEDRDACRPWQLRGPALDA